jgi:hypothetical protein
MAEGPWGDLPQMPWYGHPTYEGLSPNAKVVYRTIVLTGIEWLSWVVSDEVQDLPKSRYLPTPEQLALALDELYAADLLRVDEDGDLCVGIFEDGE